MEASYIRVSTSKQNIITQEQITNHLSPITQPAFAMLRTDRHGAQIKKRRLPIKKAVLSLSSKIYFLFFTYFSSH